MPELTEEVMVVNPLGVHARPAASLVQTTLKYQSDVFIEFKGNTVNAKSIMGLLTLGAARGSRLTVVCSGPDAEDAMAAVRQVVASGFGES
ncbi:MAG: HPr family phosphocarrier protein [Candidatus Hydrogenedens sp.]|nr:HPr family phosphocarrier protein [Candidatus Hydrogenedentota bacterium]NLF56088.1 HPr family phosphocarrier protein [Candidatus Hydrogenedens sp.]